MVRCKNGVRSLLIKYFARATPVLPTCHAFCPLLYQQQQVLTPFYWVIHSTTGSSKRSWTDIFNIVRSLYGSADEISPNNCWCFVKNGPGSVNNSLFQSFELLWQHQWYTIDFSRRLPQLVSLVRRRANKLFHYQAPFTLKVFPGKFSGTYGPSFNSPKIAFSWEKITLLRGRKLIPG